MTGRRVRMKDNDGDEGEDIGGGQGCRRRART